MSIQASTTTESNYGVIMKTTSRGLILLACAAAFATLGATANAETQRGNSGTITTDSGKTATYQRGMTRAAGEGTTRQQSVTVGDQTYSRSANTSYDQETGSVKRSVTGPRGESRGATITRD